MKKEKRTLHKQRQVLNKKLERFFELKDLFVRPPLGWLKAVRESLGLSTTQLAKRLDLAQSTVAELETREKKGNVSIEMLQRTAKAMDCELVYVILPKNKSLDKILELRARRAAEKIISNVSHSMKLEDQETSKQEKEAQIQSLAKELKEALDPQLWERKND
jgi:predicted DNA-binding mobile mystery protein A